MSQKSTALNAISLPLNQVNLIEASAGTGKTYTIGSIYLRLLLQAGENCFSRPLNVEEILVVTFTEMATEDLKRKIRERLTAAISVFSEYYETKDRGAKFRFSLHLYHSRFLSPNADAACFQFRRAFQFKTSQRSV